MTNKTDKPTHTPGPWILGTEFRPGVVWVSRPDGGRERVVEVPLSADGRGLANARLIAAAPDLLAAAKAAGELLASAALIAKTPGAVDSRSRVLGLLRSAIARAEGR